MKVEFRKSFEKDLSKIRDEGLLREATPTKRMKRRPQIG
jgi:hypothetical protein